MSDAREPTDTRTELIAARLKRRCECSMIEGACDFCCAVTAITHARADALREAAEIAAQYASDIDDGDYTGIGSDIAGDIATAILARIQEKNDG